jgi:predicted enzyme related to lactoylglutathione lyase
MPIQIKEIAFSCYAVTDFARARAFYEGVLGLKPTMVVGEAGGMQWAEYDIGSGTLSIGAGAPGWKPSPDGCSVALEVVDFAAAVAHLRAHAVVFKMEPMDTGVCEMAVFHDPDGNSLLVHRRKPQS